MFGFGKNKNKVDLPSKVFGIDFSGGTYASKKIWIAGGEVKGGKLVIDSCKQAQRLPGGSTDRDLSYKAIREFITSSDGAAFGMDFPFGLPVGLLTSESRKVESWAGFISSFPWGFKTPEDFREVILKESGDEELKRTTDEEVKAPFSPISLWIYRQTFFGIKDILKPLIKGDLVRVVPMQEYDPLKPVLMEVCPAVLLKKEKIYDQYKGAKGEFDSARESILDKLSLMGLGFSSDEVRRIAVDDNEGDAIDSIISAFIVFKTIKDKAKFDVGWNEAYSLEGYIYK